MRPKARCGVGLEDEPGSSTPHISNGFTNGFTNRCLSRSDQPSQENMPALLLQTTLEETSFVE